MLCLKLVQVYLNASNHSQHEKASGFWPMSAPEADMRPSQTHIVPAWAAEQSAAEMMINCIKNLLPL